MRGRRIALSPPHRAAHRLGARSAKRGVSARQLQHASDRRFRALKLPIGYPVDSLASARSADDRGVKRFRARRMRGRCARPRIASSPSELVWECSMGRLCGRPQPRSESGLTKDLPRRGSGK